MQEFNIVETRKQQELAIDAAKADSEGTSGSGEGSSGVKGGVAPGISRTVPEGTGLVSQTGGTRK